MLAKANRLLRAEDFRATMRGGRKLSSSAFVIYTKRDLGSVQARFGFVVAKTVGNAVKRNLVKRRLRSLAYAQLANVPSGTNVVVRALPGSAELDWNKLSLEFNTAMAKAFAEQMAHINAGSTEEPAEQ
jgi:ribonuclease P protein component